MATPSLLFFIGFPMLVLPLFPLTFAVVIHCRLFAYFVFTHHCLSITFMDATFHLPRSLTPVFIKARSHKYLYALTHRIIDRGCRTPRCASNSVVLSVIM